MISFFLSRGKEILFFLKTDAFSDQEPSIRDGFEKRFLDFQKLLISDIIRHYK